MAFIDYMINNFCSKCELEFSKELGYRCPDCNRKARSNPCNAKKFKERIQAN